jgi:DMSO reductase family type II enzyme chaperone
VTLESLSRLRQGVYRLFGAGFTYPTTEMLSAAGSALPIFDELSVFDYAFAPDVANAAAALADADLDDMGVAYVSLFEAGVGGVACSPHESAHRSDARTGEVPVLQAELKRTVLRYGLRLADSSEDMVDHVATELHVMAMLCHRQTQLHTASAPVGRVVSSQLEFLNSHLLQWVPGFARLVQAKQRHPAYTALAEAVGAFLVHERQLVPLLVTEAESLP